MADVDWSEEPSAASLAPGRYLVEVKECEERRSKRTGAPFFNVELSAVKHEGARLCFDNIMLSGRGRGIGQRKLRALGFGEGNDTIFSSQLVGRRAEVVVVSESYDGKTRLAVDIDAEGSMCGYYPIEQDPVREPDILDDTPF